MLVIDFDFLDPALFFSCQYLFTGWRRFNRLPGLIGSFFVQRLMNYFRRHYIA